MKKLTAAGGVLFREKANSATPEVLLMFRRGVWDLPKGKIEPGESMEECARREVSEEVGSSLPQIHTRLRDTYHEYLEEDQLIGKTTHWFAMTLSDPTEELEPEAEEGIKKLIWISASCAEDQVGYENLKTVLKSFAEWKASAK